MERQIDAAWETVGELKQFIIPGGCELGSRLHVARTVARRTERILVSAAELEKRFSPLFFRYMNRLGDLLFALARLANHSAGRPETTWNA